jgi:hypothetical protein
METDTTTEYEDGLESGEPEVDADLGDAIKDGTSNLGSTGGGGSH